MNYDKMMRAKTGESEKNGYDEADEINPEVDCKDEAMHIEIRNQFQKDYVGDWAKMTVDKIEH